MLKTTKILLFCAVLLVSGLCERTPASGGDRDPTGIDPPVASNTGDPDAPHPDLALVPNSVHIGLFFHEGSVSVHGTLPAGCVPALIVQGQDQAATMSIRGRKLGLWMAVGTAVFEKAPCFYQCITSGPLTGIASTETMEENGLGFGRIMAKMDVTLEADEGEENAEQETMEWKSQFVEFKKESGLYAVREDALRVLPAEGGMETIEGEILLPARSPEGRYRVTLIGFRNGTPVTRIEEDLSVKLIGSVAFLHDLALEHGWTYGIIAVIVALGAGFGVGALVPSKGAH